jgi:hypothetical protein
MWLLVIYVALMLLGQGASYMIGLFVERMWGQQMSLIVFLALYFFILWLAWVVAVKLTAPRAAHRPT